ncbi:TIGR03617 family F420-dependent LLM class oxidoreductase [Nocardia yamanashiensis]|uniref:TIGR03617 family F420-dependent LLM class oxidoreductase n=1 Tax=Nocardia yamanashiensis TaxID=209247 RepID=UPI001E3DBF1F|nr:TIGR03617 family F420-dependent LLM class oxidoreductase [Nocardia yamanashiensis]UGT39102.1 TIGR03617 family F420-dependent LLM class oxidoreductase [Nocardia yamanashiensis]
MELVTSLPADTPLGLVGERVRRIERLGFDTVHVSETAHDPFAVCALAAEHSARLTVRTSMVVAFARSPMVTACAARDLAEFSDGRFQLGVASQVRGNIVGRYSMEWSDPVARLGDYVGALRAIFRSFQHGVALEYESEAYTFTRLQPYFNPGPLATGMPQIWLGGVNRRMCELAGAVADGFVAHPTASHPIALRERLIPALTAGAERAGRDGGPRIVVVPKLITGADRAALDAKREAVRSELAFLYSTPAYRGTLDLLGFGETADRLIAGAAAKEWATLPALLGDEALAALVPQGAYRELPELLHEWYSGSCQGISLAVPDDAEDDEDFRVMLAELRRRSVA